MAWRPGNRQARSALRARIDAAIEAGGTQRFRQKK
jgi:hypothetical protein